MTLKICQLGLWFLRTALLIDIYPPMKFGIDRLSSFHAMVWTRKGEGRMDKVATYMLPENYFGEHKKQHLFMQVGNCKEF